METLLTYKEILEVNSVLSQIGSGRIDDGGTRRKITKCLSFLAPFLKLYEEERMEIIEQHASKDSSGEFLEETVLENGQPVILNDGSVAKRYVWKDKKLADKEFESLVKDEFKVVIPVSFNEKDLLNMRATSVQEMIINKFLEEKIQLQEQDYKQLKNIKVKNA